MMADSNLLAAHKDHRREWRDMAYVYAVISRRSQGVSIGVNLNPDKVCNFDCIYCEVDRTTPGKALEVNLAQLEDELRTMLEVWKSGELFEVEPFASAPVAWRRLNDIAFSGDGEPTTCPVFEQAVEQAARLRDELATPETKLVLITDSTCLRRPGVIAGLKTMQQSAHEIWAKLDAGTPEYYQLVNRTRVPFDRVIENIKETALWCPLWIQTLLLRVWDEPTPPAQVEAYCDRVNEISDFAGRENILGLQLYTVARPTPESFATALSDSELDAIAARIAERTGLPQVLSYGNGG